MAEVLLAQNDPAAAFELVERVLPVNAVDPRVVDELMVLGARAAADLVQRASDDRDQTAVRDPSGGPDPAGQDARRPCPASPSSPPVRDDTVQPARAALFAAESGRAEGVEDQIALEGGGGGVRRSRSRLGTAGPSWRLASALIQSGASGTEAAELLRGVHDYAVQQGATPLQTRVEELAASARISLTAPPSPPGAVPAAFTGLTARETEVLAHLVANRTNAEIAQALFISEKTVSVHVSNLLRKTDTGSRREVAALARRVGWGHERLGTAWHRRRGEPVDPFRHPTHHEVLVTPRWAGLQSCRRNGGSPRGGRG